jgi:hypothetical protein
MNRTAIYLSIVGLLSISISTAIGGCARAVNLESSFSAPSSNSFTAPVGALVVQSDCVITGEIEAIRTQTTGYPWELDVLVRTSEDVGSLPNPTKDKIGQVITVKADQDLSPYKVTQAITARVKYVGDVPKPGIFLFIYDVKPGVN